MIIAPSLVCAQIIQNGECNVVVTGGVRGSINICCHANCAETSRILSSEEISASVYRTAMGFLNTQAATRGRPEFRGKTFWQVYGSEPTPKAVAMCINWDASTPSQLNITSRGSWEFVTKTGSCGPRTSTDAVRCALNNCVLTDKCKNGQQCVVVDVNGANALKLPSDFVSRHQSGPR